VYRLRRRPLTYSRLHSGVVLIVWRFAMNLRARLLGAALGVLIGVVGTVVCIVGALSILALIIFFENGPVVFLVGAGLLILLLCALLGALIYGDHP
jgi:hypothetical protein